MPFALMYRTALTRANLVNDFILGQIDLLASEKRMRAWTLNRCRHMQRHRALKLQAKLFQNWASNTSRGKLSRKLHTDLAEAHERGINLEQQLAQEKERHEKVATAMVPSACVSLSVCACACNPGSLFARPLCRPDSFTKAPHASPSWSRKRWTWKMQQHRP